jgi:lipopolysaccharide/colanic/teichoic acid biosynthesis glycosyltransferase
LALTVFYAPILNLNGAITTVLYCLTSAIFSLIAFLLFRIEDRLARYFSLHDALDIVKAVVCAILTTSLIFFSLTRLYGIPRGTPIVHALILAGGLILVRIFARELEAPKNLVKANRADARENIVMIGATQLSALYTQLVAACSPDRRVLAILDDRTQSTGRTMAGVPILGTTDQLQSVLDEFVTHGITTDRVIVGGDDNFLEPGRLQDIREICSIGKLKLDFVPELVGLHRLPQEIRAFAVPEEASRPNFALPHYFEFKPVLDFFLTLAVIIVCLPLLVMVSLTVLLDVGSPLVFWQQRLGKGGRNFLLLKFRTLRPPFDAEGQPVPEEWRLSRIGRLLRQCRLDELPQLLNVLVGDMSLIGPRPLLPEDQPTNPTTRLLVRPGLSGWAQVNGGKFLTPAEKDGYDEYYIRNASPYFDLYILWRTFKVIFHTGQGSDRAVSAALTVGFGQTSEQTISPPSYPDATARTRYAESMSRKEAAVSVSQRRRASG